MPDGPTIAALLLVFGPVVGAIPIANPRLLGIWSMSRDDHVATVGANRRGWRLLNAGFVLATIATTAGLGILAVAWDGAGDGRAGLLAGATAYAVGGALWCAVLAARARTTPAIADLVAAGAAAEPAETLLGAALGGLFQGFVLVTAAALVVVGLALIAGGGITPVVGWVAVITGVAGIAILVRTGDLVPALLYPCTVLVGVALLAGWA
jgi:hypothetical protein